jgi:hypothetical protein
MAEEGSPTGHCHVRVSRIAPGPAVNNINNNFAQIISDAGLDYRVIMLATHGRADPDESICISAPLSGAATCDPPPARPVNTERFRHYSLEIRSTDSYSKILNSYDRKCGTITDSTASTCALDNPDAGWSSWLRPDATKSFIEITDDDEKSVAYDEFDLRLRALSPRHFAHADGGRDYVFHTIGGLGENNPVTEPWLPTQPLVTAKCTGNGGDSVNHSPAHQNLSILTGGLRFPICQYTSFDAVFRKVAQGVISGSRIACDFALPPPPQDGGVLDTQNMLVEYTPGDGGTEVTFGKVADESACGARRFYLTSERVILCPDSCSLVQADPSGSVDVLFQCRDACQSQGESCASSSECCAGTVCVNADGNTCDGNSACACRVQFD